MVLSACFGPFGSRVGKDIAVEVGSSEAGGGGGGMDDKASSVGVSVGASVFAGRDVIG